MKKPMLCVAAATTALLLGGCLPEEFIWWSPDGQTAAVRTSDGLRLADTNGQLSAVVLSGEIQSAAWLPDGSGVVVSRSLSVNDWAATEKLVPPEEAAAAAQLARAMPDLLKAALVASGGSWDDVKEKFLKPLGMTDSQALGPAWSCALSLHRQQILAAIAGFTNAATLEADILSSETNGIPIHEITILPMRDGHPAGEPRALIRSLRPLSDPVPSPRHSILAYRTDDGTLKAMTLDGKASVVVAGEDVPSMVWSADGCALIYVVMGKNERMGEIRSRTVVGASGELLKEAQKAESLAMAVFTAGASPRLCVLPDGRLLFASMPITLPARAASLQPGAQFFLLDPARPKVAPVAVVVKEGSLPEDLSSFAPGRDGRLVALVEGGSDVVAVLELATGQVKIISPLHAGWKSRVIPAWRNQRELTFVALPSTNAVRPEVILWRADAPERVLSSSWPEKVVKALLEAPREGADQPAK